jgi:uncharacterized membrane protein
MDKPVENHKRSIVKSVTFRVIVIISDLIIITAVTHRYDLAIGVAVATNLGSTILYYLHERVWAKIKWGIAA